MNIKHLGTVNAWDAGLVPKPAEMIAHEAGIDAGEQHATASVSIGRCLRRITCHTCRISYDINSSD